MFAEEEEEEEEEEEVSRTGFPSEAARGGARAGSRASEEVGADPVNKVIVTLRDDLG